MDVFSLLFWVGLVYLLVSVIVLLVVSSHSKKKGVLWTAIFLNILGVVGLWVISKYGKEIFGLFGVVLV